MSHRDYHDLDQWIADLDVLQQELRDVEVRRQRQTVSGLPTTTSSPPVDAKTQQSANSSSIGYYESVPPFSRDATIYPQSMDKIRAIRPVANGTSAFMRHSNTDYCLRGSLDSRSPPPPPRLPDHSDKNGTQFRHRLPNSSSFTHRQRNVATTQPLGCGMDTPKETKSVHWSSDLLSHLGTADQRPTAEDKRTMGPEDNGFITRSENPKLATCIGLPKTTNTALQQPPQPVMYIRRSQSMGPIDLKRRTCKLSSFPNNFPISLAEFAAKQVQVTSNTRATSKTALAARIPLSGLPSKASPTVHLTNQSDVEYDLNTVFPYHSISPVLPLSNFEFTDAVDHNTSNEQQPSQMKTNQSFRSCTDGSISSSYRSSGEPSQQTDTSALGSFPTERLILRVYQPDRTTKAVYVGEKTRAFDVIQILMEKNMLSCSTKFALVEKVPSLKLERCFEDDEMVMDCLINWTVSSENLIFFEEREDMYGMFENTRVWMGERFAAPNGKMSATVIKELFGSASELNLPPHREHLYVKTKGIKWKRRYCMLRNSGLYCSKRNSSNIASFRRIIIFRPCFHLYTTTGGWTKIQAPTPYGFSIRPYSTQALDAQYVVDFCASSEDSLRIWCSLLRIALAGVRMLHNYDTRLRHTLGIAQGDPRSISSSSSNNPLSHYLSRETISQDNSDQSKFLPFDRKNRSVSLNRFTAGRKSSSGGYADSTLTDAISTDWSTNGSVTELGCVTGRLDVKSSSAGELRKTEMRPASLDCATSLTSLFSCSASEKKDRPTNHHPHQSKTPTRARSVKRRFFGNGPAARRCSRSIKDISVPFDVELPSWVSAQNQKSEAGIKGDFDVRDL
ncbi:unnamed protein product [Calicophoron daubneyi]|uniref:Ras-associating domain-containing protein n=1 Tax=Calicophoron daubneyi TaxID=300641 RepID=A0AAV2U256_CALDB